MGGIFWYNRRMTAQEQAKAIAEALKGRKGEDVKIYDVRGKSALTDSSNSRNGGVS